MALRHTATFDLVTCPPSSGKRDHYLAQALAEGVAQHLGVPFESVFFNPDPRGHRASMQEKLREADGPDAARYVYDREPDGMHILLVDDAICTRQTALRCVQAAQGQGASPDLLYFVVIYS
jgi:predicted amidophosphoribosyltransferase